MRRTAALLVVIAALSMTLSAATMPGAGAASPRDRFGGTRPEIGVGLLVSTAGTAEAGHETYRAEDPKAPRPVFTRAVPAESGGGVGGLSNLCTTPDGPKGPAFPLGNGWTFYVELFATRSGAYITTLGTLCQAFADAAQAIPPAPAVAQPPTIGEIWRAVGLPTPPVGVSPDANGITGLPTWVWTTGSPPVAVGVGLLGYRVTGTARVVGFGVFPGEGGWVRSRTAGGPGDPAFAHTYEHTGSYRLGVATLWTATAVMTGPGLDAPLTIDLGTAVVTNARDYPVLQIRSQLL